mgnify:CR=1 FL=1
MRFMLFVLALVACRSEKSEQRARSPIAMDPPAAPGSLAPFVRATTDGVIATWLETPASGAPRLRFARWSKNAWSEPVTIVETSTLVASWADVPTVVENRAGEVVASWLESAGEGHAYHAIVARSVDRGRTWTRVGALHDDRSATEHGFVSLIPDDRGARAIWLDGRATPGGGATTLRSAIITTTAVEGEEIVDERVCDCCSTAMAAGLRGPIVAYRDRSQEELRDIAIALRDGERWSTAPRIRPDGWTIAGCPVNGPALDARGDHAVVAWYTYAGSQHRVKAAFSADGGETFSEPVVVDEPTGARAPLGRVAAVVDRNGDAVVAWVTSTREEGELLLRRVSVSGARGAEISIASIRIGRDAGFPELAISGDELVVIWTEPGEASRIRAARVRLADVPSSPAPTVPQAPAEVAAGKVGDAMPALEATTLDGARTHVPVRGNPTLVNVWATWCEPCRQELVDLGALHTRFSSRGLGITAVSVDRERNTSEVAEFAKRRKLPFEVVHDPLDRTSSALGIGPLPVTVLVGREGRIRWRSDGAIRSDDPTLIEAIELALQPQ